MRQNNWKDATAPDHIPLKCPACGSMDLMNGAKLTIERVPGGYYCTTCSNFFRLPEPPPEVVK